MTVKYQRRIIEVEKKLGFLYVPAAGEESMPKQNGNIRVKLDGENRVRELHYNADHKRIFGLTDWYNKMDIRTGSVLNVIVKEKVMSITMNSPSGRPAEEKESKPFINISNLPSAAKGNIAEDRVKELIVLHGQGLLNVYKPVVDSGGIDLIVLKSGIFLPIYLQVKSRFNVHESKQMTLTISGATFKPHHSFYVIGVSFNPHTLTIDDRILFIPSAEVEKLGNRLKHKNNIRVMASYNEKTKSQWGKYFIRSSDLADKLIEKFEESSKYLR
jgi:hypothetical protein